VLAAGVYVLAVHRVVQPDGPAGDDATAGNEPRGLAGGGAVRRPLRRRGHALPPRRPARGRAALDRPPACARRLSRRSEAEAAVLADDVAGAWEVRGEDEHAAIGVALDEVLSSLPGAAAVVAELAVPLRLGHLDGAVHEIAGEHGLAGRRGEPDGDVAGGVSGRRLEAQAGRDLVVLVDERDPPGGDHGHHAVGDAAGGLAPLLGLPLPELPLLAVDHVARPGKRRHPALALQARVPADVIDVQVRADDGVDLLGRDAGGGQVVEPRPLPLVPERRLVALLAVAHAGVDENRAARHPDDPGLDAGAEIARVLVEEVGLEPAVVTRDRLGRGLRQHARRR